MTKLTEKQQLLANKLNAEQLKFANLMLTKEKHKKSNGACYADAGFKVKSSKAASSNACRMLKIDKISDYIDSMRAEIVKKVAEEAGETSKSLVEELNEIKASSMTGENINLNTARLCVMDKAKLLGLIVDKNEFDLSDLTPWSELDIGVDDS